MERIPFNPAELEIAGEYAPMFPGFPGTPYFTTPITPRENNKIAFLDHETPLWLPCGDYVMFAPKVNPDNIARCFVFDAVGQSAEEKQSVADNGFKDMFGIEWVYVPTAGGSMVKPGNPTVEDANDLADVVKWPNIEEWDWEASKEANKDFVAGNRSVQGWLLNGLFERLISFMDFENAVVALIDEEQQDAVHAFFSGLCDLYEKIIDKYVECYGMDWLFFHDDWGSQRAPFFSAETCKEMLVPYVKRLVDYCHSKGIIFELHSCGSNEPLIPCMLEAGVDVWTPMANINDVDRYYETIEGNLCYGIYAPALAPTASEEEVDAAAKAYVEAYTKNGKVISGGGFGTTQAFKAKVYEYSRKALN